MKRERIAGIDYGTKRIGVAIADTETKIASPLDNYNRISRDKDAEYFLQLVRREAIDKFVVGLPIGLDGYDNQKSREAKNFGAWLTEITGVPVEYCDERYTSVEAEQMLMSAKLTKKRRTARLDKLAAQLILAAYLETAAANSPAANPSPAADPLPLDDRR
jgi:putative Holliday junction resolvase